MRYLLSVKEYEELVDAVLWAVELYEELDKIQNAPHYKIPKHLCSALEENRDQIEKIRGSL